MREAPFWLVWREDGEAPTKQHESEAKAAAEAARLARKSPGQNFYVLVPSSRIRVIDVETENFITDPVPF